MDRYNIEISSYGELYDIVKKIRNMYNHFTDTTDMIDELIYRWFSSGGVRGLDSCYEQFHNIIKEKGKFKIRIEKRKIKAEWEQ